MNSYNGFEPKQRLKALRWIKKEMAEGRREPQPNTCDGCGGTDGFMEWHSEDYSEPFGDHIGQYGLCYQCHMMLHCRFRNPKKFIDYIRYIVDGYRPKPYMSRNWERFRIQFLQNEITNEVMIPREHEFNSVLPDIGRIEWRREKEAGGHL